MAAVTIAHTVNAIRPSALIDTISRLRQEFRRMQDELRDARNEINWLRRKLSKAQLYSQVKAEIDIAALRRHLAYHCHPDRGGDTELMRRLNVLLDLLETRIDAQQSLAEAEERRAAA